MRGNSRWVRGVELLTIAVSVTATLSGALADEPPGPRRWKTPDEAIQDGNLPAPDRILEVSLQYDAEATPTVQLRRLVIKRGYVPQYESLDSGYVLSLHDAAGQPVYALTFRIPNQVFDPPPQAHESAEGTPGLLHAVDFALTVPMVQGAVELYMTDPQGLVIMHAPLGDVPERPSAPRFRSLPPAQRGPKPESELRRLPSRLAEWLDAVLIDTAEAAVGDGALDVTFIGDNYAAADLTLFYQDVDRVISHMLTYEPYTSRQSQVLFHSVDNTTVDLGCVHSAAMDRLITCNNATVTSVLNDAGAPYDKIVVLVNDPNYGGSGGAIAVSYNGGSAPQVAAHEFGHTLGELLDEYTLYTTNGMLDGATHVNCYAGSPPNSVWDGLVAMTDYSLGCDYPNWYRPSPCSIMLSLSCPYFNAVSQRQLNAKLDFYAGSLTPSLTLSASPTLISVSGGSTLSWSATNVTTCTASGGWSGDRSTSGSETVTPSATATYTLTCAKGTNSIEQTVTVTVDAQAPQVSLTAPADGATVSGTVTLSAAASDNLGVARVEFYQDGALLGADNTAPYSMGWNTASQPSGAHTLRAQAVDTAGNLSVSSPVTVTLEQSADTQPPQVTILSPMDGSRASGNVKIQATAVDNVAVIALSVLIDGVLKASSASSSISVNWNVQSKLVKTGAHTITVRAADAAGNAGTASITVFK